MWWQSFFDADYLKLWGALKDDAASEREADGLWVVLGLGPDSRVLDAPCGYGRLSRLLAERGARVVGVDLSPNLLAEAEHRRGNLPADRLRYLLHDLREPLQESGFDAAINIYSSIGYGTEADDLGVFRTLASAVRPGGLVFVETMHLDRAVWALARNPTHSTRLPDGTEMVETPRLHVASGRIETAWRWSGPSGSGEKSASLRLYKPAQVIALLESVGLSVLSSHAGCSPDPFVAEGPDGPSRLGVLARRA